MPEAVDFEREPTDPSPLPRGRHKLSLETVRRSQRRRLLRAMLEKVGEQGYEATTVPQVVAKARVSRNAFYALFADKVDCFLALCDELAEQLLVETFGGGATGDWLQTVRDGTQRYLAWWQQRPLFSRAWLLELPTAGTRALAQRERNFDRFAERFEMVAAWARQENATLAPLRPNAARLLVWGITELVAAEVGAGRAASLASLEDEIVWLIERLLAEPSR